MGPTGRRLARLTLDTLADLPDEVRSCVFWELDPVRRARAEHAGEAADEKEAWLSRVLLDWGSCGRVAYVDGEAVGFVRLRAADVLPRRRRDADRTGRRGRGAARDRARAPGARRRRDRPDAHAERGQGPDQARRDPRRRGVRGHPRAAQGPAVDHGSCVLPADYLLRVGFKTQRAHPRYPRMRLELKSAVTWRAEVEHALERLLGVVRPARPAPGPARPGVAPGLTRPKARRPSRTRLRRGPRGPSGWWVLQPQDREDRVEDLRDLGQQAVLVEQAGHAHSRLPSRLPAPEAAMMFRTTLSRWTWRPSRSRSSGPSTSLRMSQVGA